jgi:hypothetical protein
MATPTSPIDDLLGLFSTDEQAVIRAVVLKNDKARQQLEEGLTMRKEYLSDEPLPVTPPIAQAQPPVTATTTVVAPPSTTSSTVDLSAINQQLAALSESLNTRFSEFAKNVVTVDKLPQYRGELLETTLRNADQMTQIRNQHEREFPNEPFDLGKVNDYINTQSQAGRKFSDIKSAYDDMVRDKRVEARIAAGIADGVKQKKSADGAGVAGGGSGVTALAPNQELIRKMRGDGGTDNHITTFADKLRRIKEARESREGGVEAEAS